MTAFFSFRNSTRGDVCERAAVGHEPRHVPGRLEGVEETEISLAPHRLDELPARRVAFGLQRGEDPHERLLLRRLEARGVVAKVVDEHVQVARRPQLGTEPGELRAKLVGPGLVDERPPRPEEGPQPARGDPELVKVLRVVTAPCSGIVREDPLVLRPELRPEMLCSRCVGDGGRPPGVRDAERLEHLGPRIAVAGPGLPELLLEPAHELLVAVHELDLELAKSPLDAPVLHQAHGVDDDLGERPLPSPTLTPARLVRSFARGRTSFPRASPNRSSEISLGWARGTARHLELEARRPARQLQLPETLRLLDPAAQRDAGAREPHVIGVGVRRREDARRERLAVELGQAKARRRRQLHLALDRLLHGASR